jgi:hypothetical protein
MIPAIFRRARHKTAIVVTGVYLCTVIVAFAYGLIVSGPFGLAFIDFLFLSLPSSAAMLLVVGPMGTSSFAWVVCVTLCFLSCAINAVVLYAVIAGLSTFFTWALGRNSE